MKSKYWPIINSVLLLCLLGIGLSSYTQKDKQVYIKTAEVFDAFSLQKELKTKLQNAQSARQAIVDSLELKLTAMASSQSFDYENPDDEFLSIRQVYQQKKQEFEESTQQQSQEYDRQIWNQLNQYITDFGKDNNYDMIFGANGQGNLMYASDARDITEELIDYINQKYERI
jgi:outer membrane protein